MFLRGCLFLLVMPVMLLLSWLDVPSPSPSPPAKPFEVGISVIPDKKHLEIFAADLATVQMGWVKIDLSWALLEPQKSLYEWPYWDGVFATLADYDLQVMVRVSDAPSWSRDLQIGDGPPINPYDLADFVEQLVIRYPIDAIEIWHSMNIQRFWASTNGLSSDNYLKLLDPVVKRIRPIRPEVLVVSGALSVTSLNDGVIAIADDVYLDSLIENDLLSLIDCVGTAHLGYNIGPTVPYDQALDDPTALFRDPYNNPHPMWSFYSTLTSYADKIQQVGRTVPLCVTQFGWATAEDLPSIPPHYEFALDNTIQEQQQYLQEAINLMESWGFVRLAMIWNLNAGEATAWDVTHPATFYALHRRDQ